MTTTPTAPARRRRRTPRTAEVVRTEWLTPHLVRVVLGGPGLDGFDCGEFTDHYVKLVFPPPGAPYGLPVDIEAIEAEHPREHWPVLRTYTVRSWDQQTGELAVDFVHHGDEGVAPVWAAAARPGDQISLLGPGGGYAPAPDADWHLLVGDESALPAIAAALERVPVGVPVVAVIEVPGADDELPLTSPGDLELTWVHRDVAGSDGAALLAATQAATARGGDVHAFVHGEADEVRALRRHLRVELGVPPERLSVSGYWRRGRTDEGWRAEKKDWNAAVEQDEQQAG